MKRIAALCIPVLLVSGCAVKRNIYDDLGVSRDRHVEDSITRAATEIRRDLRLLNPEPVMPAPTQPEDTSLRTAAVEVFLKEIASKHQYSFRTLGRADNRVLTVKTFFPENTSLFNILSDVGAQLGTRADLHLDDNSRSIILTYKELKRDTAKMQDPKNEPKAPAVPQKKELLNYRGDIAGVLPLIAGGLGYTYRADGPPSPIRINMRSGDRNWEQIVHMLNAKLKTADIFIDHKARVVVLKYWR